MSFDPTAEICPILNRQRKLQGQPFFSRKLRILWWCIECSVQSAVINTKPPTCLYLGGNWLERGWLTLSWIISFLARIHKKNEVRIKGRPLIRERMCQFYFSWEGPPEKYFLGLTDLWETGKYTRNQDLVIFDFQYTCFCDNF